MLRRVILLIENSDVKEAKSSNLYMYIFYEDKKTDMISMKEEAK